MAQTGGWTDVGRRGPAGARRHAANRGMVETGACSRRQSSSLSARARPAKNPTAHFPSYCTSFSFSLGLGKSEQPTCPDSGGVEMQVSHRASSDTRPFSPVSFWFGSSWFGSSRFSSFSSVTPDRPSLDRGGRQGGASLASPLTSSTVRSPTCLGTRHPSPYPASMVSEDAARPGEARSEG